MRITADFEPGEESPSLHQLKAGIFHIAYMFKAADGKTLHGGFEVQMKLDDTLANVKKSIHESIRTMSGLESDKEFIITSWTRLQ